jgi:NAD(P)-dependent dehydrogenase (short-subunit alcohol dehydrogenase family)
MSFTDKVVVITGASAGIGAALAEEMSRRQAKVVLAARRADRLAQIAGRMAGPSEVVVTDVTRREQVERLFQAAVARFGQVDIWVNNAGRGITRDVSALSEEDVDAMLRDNFKSAFYGMQAVVPHFKERKQGVLVNVSSMLSRVPGAYFRSAYNAAKAAMNSLTESLRFELARQYPDILICLALPGIVATEFGLNALGGGEDSRKLPGGQTAEQVAAAIADGIAARRLDIYTRPEGAQRVLDYQRALDSGRLA